MKKEEALFPIIHSTKKKTQLSSPALPTFFRRSTFLRFPSLPFTASHLSYMPTPQNPRKAIVREQQSMQWVMEISISY